MIRRGGTVKLGLFLFTTAGSPGPHPGAVTSSPTNRGEPTWYESIPAEQLGGRLADGGTWLHAAVERPEPEKAVPYLVTRGLDANAKDDKGRTPLRRAIAVRSPPACRTLLAAGAKVTAPDWDTLIREREDGSLVFALSQGVDPNDGGPSLPPPLITAMWLENEQSVLLLLNAGADPNRTAPGDPPTSKDLTALIMATADRNPRLTRLMLVKAGPPAEWKRSIYGYTLLHLAAGGGRILGLRDPPPHWHASGPEAPPEDRIATVELLRSAGADLDATDDHGETSLFIALRHNEEKIASFLIRKGSNLSLRSKEGDTPLHALVKRYNQVRPKVFTEGDLRLLKLMLEHKPDLTARDAKGKTPLEVARELGYVDAVTLFEKHP